MKFDQAGAELSTKVSAPAGELFTVGQDSHTTCGINSIFWFTFSATLSYKANILLSYRINEVELVIKVDATLHQNSPLKFPRFVNMFEMPINKKMLLC